MVLDHAKSKKCWKLAGKRINASEVMQCGGTVKSLPGDVHEEVDVAAVPAPEVAALNEVQHLAGPHPKGQKSDAPLKNGRSHSWRSFQEKLQPEARKPKCRARTEAEVQHVLREGLKCVRQTERQPIAAGQKCEQQVQGSAKPQPHTWLLAVVVGEVGRQEARFEVEVEVGLVRNIRSAASKELREEHRRLKCSNHRSVRAWPKSKRCVDPPELRSVRQKKFAHLAALAK